MATKKGRKRLKFIPDPEYNEWDWVSDYRSNNYSDIRGPIPSRPKRKLVVVKSATLDSPANRNGSQPERTYLSTYRQRMANKQTPAKVAANKSPFKRKTSNKPTAAVKSNSTNTTSNKESNMPTVKTRNSKSTTRKTTRKRTTVKQGVVLHLVKEPAGKGGYRFDNSHDRNEKLDTTTAYVSQRDMKKTTAITLNLVAEPKGKGGVRYANSAKEKLDVTTMYLSQADRATLGVDDSVTIKVTDDGVTVTP
jgi:hypothetical protein